MPQSVSLSHRTLPGKDDPDLVCVVKPDSESIPGEQLSAFEDRNRIPR